MLAKISFLLLFFCFAFLNVILCKQHPLLIFFPELTLDFSNLLCPTPEAERKVLSSLQENWPPNVTARQAEKSGEEIGVSSLHIIFVPLSAC